MQKFIEYLEEADKITRAMDHMLYVTYPLVKDKKILLRILMELKRANAYCINSILQYEYIFKRVRLTEDPKINLNAFFNKCAAYYELAPVSIQKIRELFSIVKEHNSSSMEFTRNEKLVIISNGEAKIVEIDKIKDFLVNTKNLIEKAKRKILQKDIKS